VVDNCDADLSGSLDGLSGSARRKLGLVHFQ
jgi:hypothetical protein